MTMGYSGGTYCCRMLHYIWASDTSDWARVLKAAAASAQVARSIVVPGQWRLQSIHQPAVDEPSALLENSEARAPCTAESSSG